MEEKYISGTVDRIIYENEQNYYKVLSVFIEDTDADYEDSDITLTGNFAQIMEGDSYTFWGKLTQHPKYGQQWQVSRYEKVKPSASGLVSYLSSYRFKGIGKKLAQQIVDLYGDEAIDAILESPERLEEISGLRPNVRQSLLASLKENHGNAQILAQLADLGLSNQLASRIFEHYGENSLDILTESPYQLVRDIAGVSFQAADRIAQGQGIDAQSASRYQAGLLYSLERHAQETGDTYLPSDQLLTKTKNLLENLRPGPISLAHLNDELDSMLLEELVYQAGTDKIFQASLFLAEEGIANSIKRLQSRKLDPPFQPKDIGRELLARELESDMTYSPQQKEAISQALSHKVFLLTGGPGTGKTTVIKEIIRLYESLYQLDLAENNPIILCAPTGRAARRMSEVTGLPSATIHRHLGLTLEDQEDDDLSTELDCRLLIIDEFSMVDTWLANQLFRALPITCQVIIVGDSDQLPSVGPGQVLSDLLQVPNLPQVRLESIFRQADDSTIIPLANAIRQGIIPDDLTQVKGDRSYFEVNDSQMAATIGGIVTLAIKKGFQSTDIQILAPMYRGPAGIDALNQHMQALLNPKDKQDEFAYKDCIYRTGDRVIHLINDAENDVFNGDLGRIIDLIPAKASDSKQDELVIAFEASQVTFPRNDWGRIRLAYAMSIHKSQGSEFPVIILPLTLSSSRMLRRNLVYTAITRAKSKLILLGDYRAFTQAIQYEGDKRRTYLIERFTQTGDQTTATQPSAKYTSPAKGEASPAPQEPTSTEGADKHRLTPENYLSIDPLVGLSEADIQIFFTD
ncbi:SF1B family DNA helicase RecD2 [Streptococcus sp. DD12]|uniref:SF1B family DNA helicase RecD2 n=1 Tax=Streptococcus sp. DD12 TaxID=1777880 RepID=UPI00079245C5|nr:ATP-dependent RecD-like DNA helicase [Streptococcus sp. DD12]KXT75688.1 RecD-like DNA helicase YrrC [Streptococcus sp. DD12]